METKPNTFESEEHILSLYSQFCDEIAQEGYKKVPTQTEFCRWLSLHYKKTDRKTIYNTLHKIFPKVKSFFEQMQSDTLAAGGMLGAYSSTMTIFALKNWCNWKDKQDMDISADAKVEFGFMALPDNTTEGEVMG